MTAPINFDLIKTTLNSRHALALTNGEESHDSALRLVGQLIRYSQDADWIATIVKGLLPVGYDGNTLDEVPGMVASAIEAGFADGITSDDPKQSEIGLQIAQQDGLELFRTDQGEAYMTISRKGGGTTSFRVRSAPASQYLRRGFFKKTGKPIAAPGLKELLDTLEALALFDSPVHDVHVRVGGYDGHPRDGPALLVAVLDTGWNPEW